MKLPPKIDRKESIIPDEDLQDHLGYWQDILRLRDWDIDAAIVRGGGLNLAPDKQGRCRPSLENKSATLAIIDPIDYDPDLSFPLNQEKVLVHELIHLHFEPFWDENKKIEMEQAIVCISDALVRLANASRKE